MAYDFDAQDLIEAVELQRNVQAGEAARMAAACELLTRRLAERDAEIAELKAKKAQP